MSWTDERVELLKKLWQDGLSASQIAGELGLVTRNAVIGKVHRLGLSGRAKSSPGAAPRVRKVPNPNVRQPTRSQPAPSVRGNVALAVQPMDEAYAIVEYDTRTDVVVPMSRRVSIMELRESVCKWPMGDPTAEDFVFCGADCRVGKPYCEAHARVAYQPAQDKRRR